MNLTDFQKDCIAKAKDHLRLIPRIEHSAGFFLIRWKDLPGKVAVIVELLLKSKLPIVAFAEELKISSKALSYFTKGKDHTGAEWPELFKILKPEEFKKDEQKKQVRNKEETLTNEILQFLSRETVLESGLRDETIKTEMRRKAKSRFVSTVLSRLNKAGKVIKFIGDKKKLMWKITPHNKEIEISEEIEMPKAKVIPAPAPNQIKEYLLAQPDSKFVEVKPEIVSVKPEIVSAVVPHVTVTNFPAKEEIVIDSVKEKSLEWAWKTVLKNLKPEQIASMSQCHDEILIRVPFKGSCFDYPFSEWRVTFAIAVYYFPRLCPFMVDLYDNSFLWADDLHFLSVMRATQTHMGMESEQKVVDHFKALISLSGVEKAA